MYIQANSRYPCQSQGFSKKLQSWDRSNPYRDSIQSQLFNFFRLASMAIDGISLMAQRVVAPWEPFKYANFYV